MTARFVTFLLNIPNFIWIALGISFALKRSKEFAQKPFVCPNCGNTFRVSWQRLFFKLLPLLAIRKAPLKCVHCDRKDLCRWKEEAP
ncbi:MAG: hypothetical protein IJ281_06180 [Clostridia bacterium]|nr:hypothetical protein [Clostridia bacterium]